MKKITIDDVMPIENYMICTLIYIGKEPSSILVQTDEQKEKWREDNMQKALKIRFAREESKYKAGQTVLIQDGRINATTVWLNDMEYYILPEFEIRAIVNE